MVLYRTSWRYWQEINTSINIGAKPQYHHTLPHGFAWWRSNKKIELLANIRWVNFIIQVHLLPDWGRSIVNFTTLVTDCSGSEASLLFDRACKVEVSGEVPREMREVISKVCSTSCRTNDVKGSSSVESSSIPLWTINWVNQLNSFNSLVLGPLNSARGILDWRHLLCFNIFFSHWVSFFSISKSHPPYQPQKWSVPEELQWKRSWPLEW